jgi:hypothetical protein
MVRRRDGSEHGVESHAEGMRVRAHLTADFRPSATVASHLPDREESSRDPRFDRSQKILQFVVEPVREGPILKHLDRVPRTGGRHGGGLSAHQIASSDASLIRDGVRGHPPQHGAPVGDFGVLLRLGDTAARAKDDDLRDVAVVHPASQPISVKPFARDEFDENHGQASKAIHGMSIAQAGLFRKFMELPFKTHGHRLHREDDGNGLPSEYT